jgi:hypothetical protein
VGHGGAAGFSLVIADGGGRRKRSSAVVFRGGDGAPVVGEGVDKVQQLEEVTRQVRHGPKGANEGHMGELTEPERNGGTLAVVQSSSADTRPRREGKGVTGCSGALTREDDRGRKGGGGDEAPFIGDAAEVGDGPWVPPRGGKAWGRAWGQRDSRAARRGR